jgi:glutamyl endopeptidase
MIHLQKRLVGVVLSLLIMFVSAQAQQSKSDIVGSGGNESRVTNVDTRRTIEDTTRDFSNAPWRSICKVIVTFKDGATAVGTGTLVGRHHVLTAGHVVFNSDHGGWASHAEIIPGYSNDQRPYGSSMSKEFISLNGYVRDRDPNYDLAFIITQTEIGDKTGWFGIRPTSDTTLTRARVHIAGYPTDIDDGQSLQYTDGKVAHADINRVHYTFNTFSGMSGAGIFFQVQPRLDRAPDRYVIAVHTTGGQTENSGTRIREDIWDWVMYCIGR